MDFWTWAGPALEAWTPLIAAVSLFVSAFVAFLALRRQDVREHHRWLQEKRREAYVEFLSVSRRASSTISADRSHWKTPKDREAAIDHDEDELGYALDVLTIVGPEDMAARGRQIVARLKLDRLFYSTTRDQQLLEGKHKYIGRARSTGNLLFHKEFAALYTQDPFDFSAYEKLHEKYPLRTFWRSYTREARHELSKARPSFWGGLFS